MQGDWQGISIISIVKITLCHILTNGTALCQIISDSMCAIHHLGGSRRLPQAVGESKEVGDVQNCAESLAAKARDNFARLKSPPFSTENSRQTTQRSNSSST